MGTRPDAGSSIPISAARLYPHVADDEDGTNVTIIAGPMDVTHLVVEVGVRVSQQAVGSQGVLHTGRGRIACAEALSVQPTGVLRKAETAGQERPRVMAGWRGSLGGGPVRRHA